MPPDPHANTLSLRPTAALAGLVIAITLVVFWPATGFDFVDIDDPAFVTENPPVRGGLSVRHVHWAMTEFHASNWMPVTFVSLMTDSTLFGEGPRGFHTTNVVLHAMNAALLLLVVTGLGVPPRIGVLVTLLFALHPMRAESVAWVAERKGVLSAFFWLATTAAWLHWLRHRGRARYGLSVGLFALGLMAKGILVTLPFALLLMDYAILRRTESTRHLLLEKLPLFVLAITTAALTFIAQATGTAVTGLTDLSITDRIANAIVGYATYPLRLIWPVDLSFYYPHPAFRPPHEGWPAMQVLGAAALLVVITGACTFAARRGHRGVLAGWGFYLLTLLPVIGLVQVGMQASADRYSYLPHIGLLWMVVAGVRSIPVPPRAALGCGALALLASTWFTVRELPHWRDSESLFRQALSVTEHNGVAMNALGTHLFRTGRQEEGIQLLRSSVEAMPRFADARASLGVALVAAGQDAEAESHLRQSLEWLPEHTRARTALANLLARRGDLGDAVTEYRRSLEIDPNQWQAEFGLGLIARLRGREEAARQRFEAALAVAPDDDARQAIEARLR